MSINQADLLFEIFCEELPHGSLNPEHGECRKIFNAVEAGLRSAGIGFSGSDFYLTPRRIAGCFKGVPTTLSAQEIVHPGPPVKLGFKDGKPTPALMGFLKKFPDSSLPNADNADKINRIEDIPLFNNQIDQADKISGVSGLYRKSEAVGEVLIYYEYREERSTRTLLGKILTTAFEGASFEKSMYWGEKLGPFLRPVRSLIALLGKEVLKISFLGIKADNTTKGHRFLSNGAVTITSAGEYREILRTKYVIADPNERLTLILDGVKKIESIHDLKATAVNQVAPLVAALTEYPLPILAEVDPALINIPPEVVMEEMIEHQKYFPTFKINKTSNTETLSHAFIFVANGIHTPMVSQGNINVLTSRLRDGIFLYEEDLKTGLNTLIKKSHKILFQQHLGSYGDKANRLIKIIHGLQKYSPQIKTFTDKYSSAELKVVVDLLKSDLASAMVFEFPHLQGIMGKYYLEETIKRGRNANVPFLNDNRDIPAAIKEHYLPLSAKGALPSNPLAVVMALAEKLDNLLGLFAVGLLPTGGSDPYALRRQGYGVIRIIIENYLSFPIAPLLQELAEVSPGYQVYMSAEVEGNHKTTWLKKLEEFILGRYRTYGKDFGLEADEIEAGLTDNLDVYAGFKLSENIKAERSKPEFVALANALKRIENITQSIVSKEKLVLKLTDEEKKHYHEKAELELLKVHEHIVATISQATPPSKEQGQLFQLLYGYNKPLDNFFEQVFINVDNKAVRTARVFLLLAVKNQILKVFDPRKVQI